MRKPSGVEAKLSVAQSETEAVGLGWLQTLGFGFKARESEREKKNHSQK